ncbi:MAG: GHMP kinase [Akkermansiaceae bacterium]|nr:GHMP kinase [Akkermansiaceae bacterium]MCP5547203.1 GHMP kinase [Akkermansiaceae bacterium]
MSPNHQIAPELAEFERMLKRPNSDPTGLAGFFNPGQIWVARVPARLDVMGGIADYSGANVCEAVLGSGNLIALQPRTDRTLRIRTVQIGERNLPVETRIPLDYFIKDDQPSDYRDVRATCQRNPLASWAAYIGGSIFTMLREEGAPLAYGFSMLLLSGVPMNVGIGSSAATEVGTICCLNAYLGLDLSAERIAKLAQLAENHVVGAPCGSMDQIAVASGRMGCLTHILCRPGSVEGEVEIPPGTGFVGINSMVRHSVGGHQYGDVRIGAFMGKRMINSLRADSGKSRIDYLTVISPEEWREMYRDHLPEEINGADFLSQLRTHDDPVTTVQPGAVYRVRGPTEHAILENERVLRFMDALKAAKGGNEEHLIEAGNRMYEAHESYRDNCRLSVPEVDFLVESVRKLGPQAGLYGAKITGGGSGGTVAVFGKQEALDEHIPVIAREYSRRIGSMPDIFTGTSPGAVEFRARRYSFDASGWHPTLL